MSIDAAATVTSLPTGSMLPVDERQAAELRGATSSVLTPGSDSKLHASQRTQ